jgi:type VI secretion system protein ImpK
MAHADLPKTLSGDNLAFTHQEAITTIVRVRSARQVVPNAQQFRQQFIETLKLAQEQSRVRGYTDEETRDGRFAVVAFLDETVLNLRTPVFADWVRKPLQEELFGTHTGGELFFQKIDSLMRQPDSQHLADVLEVYLLCLTLGYAGKYSVSGRGELTSFKQEISSRISRIRGPEKDIAPRWRPEAAVHLSSAGDPWLKPLLYTAISCFVLVLVLFAVYKFSLQSAIASTTSSEAVGVSR